MKIKSLNCPNCSAKLKLNPGETSGICSYCNSPFILDDEIIKVEVEHEIIDNTSLEIASTTLNKFKDYPKAELLYRSLFYKHAHKDEVYIGLIRSMTYDFNKDITQLYKLNEINDYWQKYTSLATKTNISKYSSNINELNKKYWLNILTTQTNNFSLFSLKINPASIENAWNKYILFSEEKEYLKLEGKFKEYLENLKKYQIEKKKKNKRTLIIITSIILMLIIFFAIYVFTETPRKKYNDIKTSNLYKYCGPNFDCDNNSFAKQLFIPTIANLTITDTKFDKEKNSFLVTANLKSSIKNVTKNYTFKIVDDSGPYIKQTNCKFTDTEEIDLTKCFILNDYSDGVIDSSLATIDKENINFKEQGIKIIKVTAVDKDKNKETKEIKVTITPTPIDLSVALSKNKIQINETATLSYNITPNVSNKEVNITYNKEYLKIENNVITPLKIGSSEICITSKYDPDSQKCLTLEITPICQNSYTFNFDGSKEEKIISGKDFCSGTYKIYANVLNRDSVYFVYHILENGRTGEILMINKNSPFNDEGTQYALSNGAYFKIPAGVTSFTLTK